MEKWLPITNETDLAAHINRSVGSACHNALCSTNDATKTHMAAVCGLHTLCFIDTFVGAMPTSSKEDMNDDGKRYCISKNNNKTFNNYPLQATQCNANFKKMVFIASLLGARIYGRLWRTSRQVR